MHVCKKNIHGAARATADQAEKTVIAAATQIALLSGHSEKVLAEHLLDKINPMLGQMRRRLPWWCVFRFAFLNSIWHSLWKPIERIEFR